MGRAKKSAPAAEAPPKPKRGPNKTSFKGKRRRTRSYERQAAVGLSLEGPPPARTMRPVRMLKISEDIIKACAVVLDLGNVHAHHAAAIAFLNMTNKVLSDCGQEGIDINKLTSATHFLLGVKRGRGIIGERWHEIAKRNKIGPYSEKAIANKAKRAMADARNNVGVVAAHGDEASDGQGAGKT